MGIKFDKDPLAIEQIDYLTKIVNAYIVYELEVWSKTTFRNFTLKCCLFGASNILKNSDKEKYMYKRYGIAFNGKGKQSFENDYSRNVIIFGVNNSLSSHADNIKKEIRLVLPETLEHQKKV